MICSMAFYLKLDPRTRLPRSLLRTRKGSVDVWNGNQWQTTQLSPMQLAGMGGDSDFYTIKQADVKDWQSKLPAA